MRDLYTEADYLPRHNITRPRRIRERDEEAIDDYCELLNARERERVERETRCGAEEGRILSEIDRAKGGGR